MSTDKQHRRAIILVIDGLRADVLDTDWMPTLNLVASKARVFSRHRGVFPSATRVSSASIATGCWPGHHGLAGNAIALDEGEGLKAVSVGPAGFRERWRANKGRTLKVPTLAQHVADAGGMVIHSNSSPGAAHMQDPEGYSTFFHRSGSWTRGFAANDRSLEVTYDGTGDAITAARCYESLLNDPPPAINLIWICEPDHTQHAIQLGSPDHRAILAGSDRIVAQMADAVARLRAAGESVLFVIASDHGQETADQIIDVDSALIQAGYKRDANSTDAVVASSGMGGLLYLDDMQMERAPEIANWFRAQSWCRAAWHGNELAEVGQQPTENLGVAFAMSGRDEPNAYGVRGYAHVIKDPFSPADSRGLGQHGGMGPHEGSPILVMDGPEFDVGVDDRDTALVDIAPSVLQHLKLSSAGLDGRPLQTESTGETSNA